MDGYKTPKEQAAELFTDQLTTEQARLSPRDRARQNSLLMVKKIKEELKGVEAGKRWDYYTQVEQEIEAIYGRPTDPENTKGR